VTRRPRQAMLSALLGVVAAATALAVAEPIRNPGADRRQSAPPVFPHERHARLFPVCTGCHEGIPTGDAANFFPSPELCSQCHNGQQLKTVTWSPPTLPPTNLRFRHPAHIRALGDSTLPCETCHTAAGAPRMAVQLAVVGRCLSCHAPSAQQHYVDAPCATCHVPLVETRFTPERMLSLPYPQDHAQADFLSRLHGRLAATSPERCATCHARQRCESCHVDAAANAIIAKIPAAPSTLRLPVFAAHYFTPESHHAASWLETHGASAATGSCGTCHVREDCAVCHRAPLPQPVAVIPTRAETEAPGIGLKRMAPPSHARSTFLEEHGTLASASSASCNTCHSQRQCKSCHEAPGRTAFHPANFLERHASAAWSRRLECSNCHEVAVFCRACHVRMGMGTSGRLTQGFHDAEPLWLLRHGQAARQGLESCASCHKQSDCLQCHSTLGAFHVNPHGPDFDAVRAHQKNPVICFACHVVDPLKGGNP
jgi:hypothetical protein